ncbi:MAG: pantetheine-phosphate adenylyltransferase [Thermoplasmatota archaeon]
MEEKVIIGGTFDGLHIGHHKMLEAALDRGCVTIGLVSDEMLKEWKPQVKRSFEKRKDILEEYLYDKEGWEIRKIDDPYDMAVEGDHDILIVSWETKKRGEDINKMRKDRGKDPLELVTVDPVLAEDFLPVSSTRIREGEINEFGERLKPVRIFVVAEKDLELEVIKNTFSSYFDISVDREMYPGQDKTIPKEIPELAEQRAKVPESYDYGIGVADGFLETEQGIFSLCYAVVKDRYGNTTRGNSPVIKVPNKEVIEGHGGSFTNKIRIKADEKGGVSKGVGVKTGESIKVALQMAMIPRMKGDVYHKG